jgi:ComF family protein
MCADRRLAARCRAAAAGVLGALRDAVFPGKCLECGTLLPPAAAGGAGPDPWAAPFLDPFFCEGCLKGVIALESPLCPRCGVMFKGRAGEDHFCGCCLEAPPAFQMARAAFVYDLSLVDVVHCLKYKGKTRLARPLGVLLAETYRRYWGAEPVDLVVPVPLHRRRLKERGFNQASLLLRHWRGGGGAPLPPVEPGLLERVKDNAPQAGLGRQGRAVNIDGAFAVRHAERIAAKHLLLVDDVITTGATVGACAQALIDRGARRVDVLALARVI